MAEPAHGPNRLHDKISVLDRLELERVERLPKVLEPGIIYFSERFRVAAHLCACGCGERVITPIGNIDWSLDESSRGPSLYPSIGNWNLPCRSHYWIRDGRVIPSRTWSNEEVQDAAAKERRFRSAKSDPIDSLQPAWRRIRKALDSIIGLFR
ncbi:DUF6527 family protein [Sphingomonas alba]|uniref:DUF6527 family protein n=1 Tax=Sphingomonas alba TaxID=2908208 RepID=UPI003D696521